MPTIQFTQQSYNVYFLGKLILAEGNSVTADRLGSVRSGGPGGLGHQAQYPYGVEYTLTANDREKYATYTRDSLTGLDYAVNRYYSSQWGRFLSPDPYTTSAELQNPQSWNRYAYVENDPVNLLDPPGLNATMPLCYFGPFVNLDTEGFSFSRWSGVMCYFDGGGGGFSPGDGGNGGYAVNKTFQANDPCNKSATQVLGDIEHNFGAFANTQSAVPFAPLGVPVGTLASSATFSGGRISVGATVTAQEVVTPMVGAMIMPTVTETAVLLVTSVTANGFILAPQPGAPLTGSITFSFAQMATGSISASITLLGNPQGGIFTQLLNSMALSSGGRQIENTIWNNVLSNISKDCGTAPPQH